MRSTQCLIFGLLLATLTAQCLAASETNKPNILFIMVDDLGKDWIGCYGADHIDTPRIDALARGGMKFNNAWSMPQCTPTRDPYIHMKNRSRTHTGKFGPDVYCNFLIDFMKQHHDEPQMLYFAMTLTHGPLVTTPAEPKASRKLEKQKAMVRYTDQLVGRLVDALDELKLRERTIVIFTTDNGSGGSVLGTIDGKKPSGGKASKYEGGVCEPFVANCPGTVPAGIETDALTDFTDLLPTFAELAGADLPENTTIDGKSFASLITGQAKDSPREWIMALGHGPARLDENGVRGKVDYTARVLRDKRYKVWVGSDRKIAALYDLTHDSLERKNLLGSTSADHVAALNRFRTVVASTPAQDARPRYRPRNPLPWDKKLGERKSHGKSSKKTRK